MAFPSVSALVVIPAFPLESNSSGLKFLRWVGGPIPQLGAMPIYWRWSLQVLSPCCWVFQLMSSPLGPGRLLHPWGLGFSSGSPHSPPRTVTYFNSSPGVLDFSSHTCSFCPLFPPSPHSHAGSSLPLPPMIILFPLLNENEAYRLWPSFF